MAYDCYAIAAQGGCAGRLRITGITLHSYRYAGAERAKCCGFPERFAQEALGHYSSAVHHAYARKAQGVARMTRSGRRERKGCAAGAGGRPTSPRPERC